MNNNVYNQLFNVCESECEAYAECGGGRTSPCGCIWPYNHVNRHQCKTCYIHCREKELVTNPQKILRDFNAEIESGLSLDQVSLKHEVLTFPSFIPSYTDIMKKCSDNSSEYLAIDIKHLFNCRKRGKASLRPIFKSESDLRSYFKVDNATVLIVVFNSFDWRLESVWNMKRVEMFDALRKLGFKLCTGPTFSISYYTHDGAVVPFSHHTIMLMRHHRMMFEASNAGLLTIPNLYWLDGENIDLSRWQKWLINNPDVHIISKDFTSEKNWKVISERINDLVSLLDGTNRAYHIFIIGSGHRNATRISQILRDTKHSVSFVTSAPAHKAMCGEKYVVSSLGELESMKCSVNEISNVDLLKLNCTIFDSCIGGILYKRA